MNKVKEMRKRSKKWNSNMSKYIGIFKMNDRWIIKSNIFIDKVYYKTATEAEKIYEEFIVKNNIPLEYIIRKGWQE